MNILFVSHTGGRAGAETVLINVIKAVATHTDHQMFLALPNDGDQAMIDALGEDLARKITIRRFAYRPIRNSLVLLVRNLGYGMLLGLPAMTRWIKEHQIDLVYTNSSVNVVGVMAARRAKIPYLWHIHEQSTPAHRWAPQWFNRIYTKWLTANDCRSIFVSQASCDTWLSELGLVSLPNSTVLYSPFLQCVPNPNKYNSSFTFGYIGALTANKNIERLIVAFGRLPGDYRLLIGGRGEQELRLQKLAADDPRIEFLGRVDPQQFYDRIDALVVVSLNESWGLVVLEAMSAHVAVVVTKNTGLIELLNDKKDCIFVEPTSVEQIGGAMAQIATQSDLRLALIDNAKRKLERRSINTHFLSKIFALIDEAKA